MKLLVHETPDYTAQTTKEDFLHDSRVNIPPSAKTRRRLPARAPQDVAQSLRPPPRGRLPKGGATSYKRNTQASLLDQEPLVHQRPLRQIRLAQDLPHNPHQMVHEERA